MSARENKPLIVFIMKISSDQLKTILLEAELITKEQFDSAQKKAEENNQPIEDYFIESGLISNEYLGQLIASFLDFPFIDLRKEVIPEEIIKIIPEIVARNQKVIIFNKTKEGLMTAMLPAE